MNCASSDISPANFWSRAETALKTGASADRRWPTIVSRTATKLQTPEGGIYEKEAAGLAEIGARLTNPDDLARWCELAARDTPYVVAVCRIQRKARKTTAKSKKLTLADVGNLGDKL